MSGRPTYTFVVVLAIGTLGCASLRPTPPELRGEPSYRRVLVVVTDSKTSQPVEGATVSVAFHPRTRLVTGHDGKAMLRLSYAEAHDPVFDVEIVNKQYNQHYGYSETRNEWMNRSGDFIPTKPDIVLEVISRLDERRAEDATNAQRKAAEQTAEKLFRNAPDYWPERTNDVAEILFSKRWEHALKRALGSKEDMDSIHAAIIGHMKNPKAEVHEIRWISATLVMAKSSWYTGPLASAGYTYVLRKSEQGWTVLTYAMDYIS